jgi:hypothetical protein
MSVIETFYDTTVTVSRVSSISPTGSDVVSAVGTVLGTLAIETEPEQLYFTNDIGKEFDFYCNDTEDILIGDTLTTGGKSYNVKALSDYTDRQGDIESHLKIRVVAR